MLDMQNFWNLLPRPFTALAPLDGVTDVVFRQIITAIGKPDVLFTEFTSCDGIMSPGRARVAERLLYKPNEQPIVAQIWGANPNTFFETARYVKSLGFVGIDINMGCPDRTVVKDGACSALIRNHKLAKEIIHATRKGAGGLPVSVKTRIGLQEDQIDEWIGFLLQQNLAALIVHLRTVKELSQTPAHWEWMPRIVELRNKYSPQTLIIGNGDIQSLNEVREKFETYHCEGFMIGRGIFHNPWMFDPKIKLETVTVARRVDLFLKHIQLFEDTWGDKKNPANLKKFCKTYIQNFPDASSIRESIMKAKTLDDIRNILHAYKTSLVSYI